MSLHGLASVVRCILADPLGIFGDCVACGSRAGHATAVVVVTGATGWLAGYGTALACAPAWAPLAGLVGLLVGVGVGALVAARLARRAET